MTTTQNDKPDGHGGPATRPIRAGLLNDLQTSQRMYRWLAERGLTERTSQVLENV